MKISLFATNKKDLGYRNVWDVTACRGDDCKLHGQENDWPEIQAYQNGPGFQRAAIEYEHGDPRRFKLHIATNDERQWANGRWLEAGRYEICVTMPHLKVWRCTRGVIDEAGKAQRGPGSWPLDRENYDVAK